MIILKCGSGLTQEDIPLGTLLGCKIKTGQVMTENKFVSTRIIDGRPRRVIVDEIGKIVNRKPNKEELKDLKDPYIKPRQKYSDGELLEYLKQFYKEKGRSPKEEDFSNNSKYPNFNTYANRFGSWNNAIREAGLQTNNFTNTSDEELLGYLIQFYEKKGRVPIEDDLRNNSKYPNFNTYVNRFGSWNNAIRDAGLWNKIYNPTNTCYRCIEEEKTIEESQLYHACKEKDKYGKETGKWICWNHWKRDYDKYNPNSIHNIIKSMRDSRIGRLDPNSNTGKGGRFEKLSEIYFGVDNLNIKNNNYNSPIDHSRHPILGILQTKGRLFSIDIGAEGGWGFKYGTVEHFKQYDNMILWCASNDGWTIERGYIIPKKEINKRSGIAIVKSPSKGGEGQYEQYRIKNEEEIKKINDIWNEINDRGDKRPC